jgi:hypothetical protein
MAAIYRSENTQSTKSYEVAQADQYPARCIQFVDLGTQKNRFYNPKDEASKEYQHKCMIVFELSELMEDGRPFTVKLDLTWSMAETASLRKMLEAWRKKPFLENETKEFNFSNILDKCCLINVSVTEPNDKGRVYNSIKWSDVKPLPSKMECPERINELVDFGINDIGTPEFDKLWPWVAKIVMESKEGKRYEVKNESSIVEDAF